MSEPDQHKPRRVEYTPPASQQIEHYTIRVCHDLGDEFATSEVIDGLTQFVKVVVKIIARQKNEEGTFDNESN